MKKPELLAPAGNMDSLKAAICAGCDAVYLGGYKFGARSFAGNFSDTEIVEAISYAHLYGVKIYVTINTLVYEEEVSSFIDYVDFLYKSDVDAVIIQDIGMMDLVRKTFPDLEVHISTQMHIHNMEGTKVVSALGCTRTVIAREVSYLEIKEIKNNVDIELEAFVQGALCISYSGQCLFSSLIGNRSGNRGTCAGSCRQKYNLVDEDLKKVNSDEYLLSTKDLSCLEDIGLLIEAGIDSFKIEGRMKSSYYVYLVVSLYRKAIDSYIDSGYVNITSEDIINLKKLFNRGFTKGFILGADNNDIVNQYRPNHLGVEVGEVIKVKDSNVVIKLSDSLCVQDGIRFISDSDTGLIVTSMLKNDKKVQEAFKGDCVSILVNDIVKVGSKVLKTTDFKLNLEIENNIKGNNRRVGIDISVETYIDKPMRLILSDGINIVDVYGDLVECAKSSPLSFDRIKEQVTKMGNTVYEVKNIDFLGDDNIFISIKSINDLRRRAVDLLNEKRLLKKKYRKEVYKIELPHFEVSGDYNILINDKKHYDAFKDYNFNNIYIDGEDLFNSIDDDRKILKLERVMSDFKDYDSNLLVGELGSINKYNNLVSDFSFNVANSYSVALLHSLGVFRVTLSYEVNDNQIIKLIDGYKKRYNKLPNLELIVFGKEEVMITKFDLLKYFNVTSKVFLQDRFLNLYPIIVKDDLMHIYNFRCRNMNDYSKYFKMGINSLRFNVIDDGDMNELMKVCEEIKWK